jgi:hypothetical protein
VKRKLLATALPIAAVLVASCPDALDDIPLCGK